MNGPDIIFPNLGIEINNLNPIAFRLFGIEVYWYGIIIALAVFVGLFIAQNEAKRTNQDPNIYFDFLIYAFVFSVIGARLYYVIFAWNEVDSFFSVRDGGLAIYGAIIAAVITLYFYTKIKKLSFFTLADTACLGLIAGQIIGRWGNFLNREAYGGYTESLFAMMLKREEAKSIPVSLLDKTKIIEGIEYIQVQPTFLYESLWNIGVLMILIFYRKKKKFEGEIFAYYILGYALGRFWIEGLRTDQLLVAGTNIPVSQVVALLSAIAALVFVIIKRRQLKNT
ncbi:phosphatidylglycerol:prolipoprotein diacylglycerol transferase [Natranaerovirga hydrolytica]|uniref:Phosphatidylglycerol--prolipoprotein diacylglyceryl transferase n=1 Tax=Natranaerovirga hydrolytica TaxID=680378 RepID=A0A4R1MXL6_9FIRM|nr:prolipoprotein diacylglyceryl transferase [Natranaerovirga hydrolytica]TCK97855.1 phosphatidylglycerol:prolipoprotein diacylglycerol transferase [Natranaerovirga hydrolytica]